MSDVTNDGGAAFPRPYSQNHYSGESVWEQGGMSLRDYFAGQALAGMAGRGLGFDADDARWCYGVAEIMLEAREAKR